MTSNKHIVQKPKLALRRWHVLLNINPKGTKSNHGKTEFFEIVDKNMNGIHCHVGSLIMVL